MAFDTPTLDDLHEFLLALLGDLFSSNSPDVSRGAFNWLFLRTLAGGVTDNHAHIESVKTDLMPDTAQGAELGRWGVIKGVIQKPATPSRGTKVLRFFGTPGTVVPNNAALSYQPSGLQFQTASSDVVGAGDYVDVDVVSIDVGSATRLSADAQLTLLAGVAGLQDTAELQRDLVDGGEDLEDPGAYRGRQLLAWSSPPLGGAATDYVQWALAVTGIATAYCYPIRAGVGTVDVAALHNGSGADRVLLAGEVTSLQAVIDSKRPIAVKACRVLTTTTLAVPVEYTITPNGALQNRFDWDDTTPPIVLAWTAGTRTLQFTGGTRPPSMQAGHRITLATGATGAERVIESLSGADSIILELDAAGDTPVAAQLVYSGGPLVAPARAAIQALFDSLGPANPDAKAYGEWEGNLDPGEIDTAARGVAGVKRGTVIAPGALVEAADPRYPDDGTIQLLIAGRILVRSAH